MLVNKLCQLVFVMAALCGAKKFKIDISYSEIAK